MKRLITIGFLLLAMQSSDPHLTAYWDSSISATVSWTQESRGCLYRNTVFIGCFTDPGTYHVEFGHQGPLDGQYRPKTHDRYRVEIGGVSYYADLVARPLYLPVILW